jgi:DNA polymerase III epsilon subunit-like protein
MDGAAVVFDTETTGLVKTVAIPLERQPRVIEFCALLIDEHGNELDALEFLCAPGVRLEPIITKITGLTNAAVDHEPPFRERCTAVREFLGRAPRVVAHNLRYDMDLVGFEFQRAEQPLRWPEQRVCTVENTLHLHGHRLSLVRLHEELFGEEFPDAHRARNDVEALARCYVELVRRGVV